MDKELIVLVGPPCSGKTTLARDYADNAWAYVNQDTQGKGHLELFKKLIEKGENIIVDRMGFNKAQRARYLEPAKAAGYTTRIIVLPIPTLDECLARCLIRKDHPTVKTYADARGALQTFFQGYQAPVPMEADAVIFMA